MIQIFQKNTDMSNEPKSLNKFSTVKVIMIFAYLWCASMFVYPLHNVQNYVFKQTKNQILSLDVYNPDCITGSDKLPCIIFVYGGGFITGHKREEVNRSFCMALADSGYVVAAIDYRKEFRKVLKMLRGVPQFVKNAIDSAVLDIIDATNYVIANAEQLQIDTSKIMLSGSSSGAVAVLNLAQELSCQTGQRDFLHKDFRYRGFMSFSGGVGVYKTDSLYFAHIPAPVLLFQGVDDFYYNCYKNGKFRLYGSKALTETLAKHKFPYRAYHYTDSKHEISFLSRRYNLAEIVAFARCCLANRFTESQDFYLNKSDIPPSDYSLPVWRFVKRLIDLPKAAKHPLYTASASAKTSGK